MNGPRAERLNPKYCRATVKYHENCVIIPVCYFGKGIGPIYKIYGVMGQFIYRDIAE